MKLFKLLMILLMPFCLSAQNQIYQEIQAELSDNSSFELVDVFNESQTTLSDLKIDREVLEKASIVDLDMHGIRHIWAAKPDFIKINVPQVDGSVIPVQLMRHNIFTSEFILRDSKTMEEVEYVAGVHYKGIIESNENSIAAFSFFPEEIMGMISSDHGNTTIAKAEKVRDNEHMIYNDVNLNVQNPFECGTPDDGYIYTKEEINYSGPTKAVGDCIKLYLEIDDDIVTDKGGVTGATNYITGLFNESITLYANDQIDMSINEILAWSTPAPYSGSSSSAMLSSYQSNTGNFNGDLSHLLSYQASGGIAAGFSGICASNVDNSKCFSSIASSYSNVPTYSWSVMVVTHEMGHLIGSRHTHACVWNGNGTAIDGCSGGTEGSCALPGNPAGGGTIMSYCHLQSVGINLSLGFGPQPGNVVRGTVNNATCLSPCGPGCNDGIQNGDETGVDCGGSVCPACPTCTDGIQNGDETGVDCGGTTCPPCPAVYCGSSGSNTTYEWIQSVSIANLSNTSGNNGGYADFTSMTANMDAGSGYSVNLTPGFASTTYAEYWRIWIDLNGDSDFDDSGELVFEGNGTAAVSGTLNVPASAMTGNTRMRVSMLWNAYPTQCQNFTYGEVEDYTVNIGTGGGPTCTDGIQNGDETGVDCGGATCPACPTCFDGIQNGDETGVDCGGATCPACPTCFDGIQNGDETGVDCGGATCPACPTCSDGIQNGDETGVDCGGAFCDPCSGGCTNTQVDYNEFNSWGIWNDGGSDCRRSGNDAAYAYSGSRCVRIRDNSGSSHMTTDNLDLSNTNEVTLNFTFITVGMDNSNEGFILQYSTNGGGSYSDLVDYRLNTDFSNNVREFESLLITGTFGSTFRFRFRNDASVNADRTYIDDVEIIACVNGAAQENDGSTSLEDPVAETTIKVETDSEVISDVKLYPVPAQDELNVSFENVQSIQTDLMMVDMYGNAVYTKQFVPQQGRHVEKVSTVNLLDGVYFVVLHQDGKRFTKRFIVVK